MAANDDAKFAKVRYKIDADWLAEDDNLPDSDEMRALLPDNFPDFIRRRQQILHWKCYPLLPLTTDGMPGPGPDYDAFAEKLCGEIGRPKPALEDAKGITGKGSRKAREELAARNDALMAGYRVHWHKALEYAYLRSLYDPKFWIPVAVKQKHPEAKIVSGTTRGDRKCDIYGNESGKEYIYGPTSHRWPSPYGAGRPRVMVVGKHPGYEEEREGKNFIGPSSVELIKACRACGIDPVADIADWYFTNVVKFCATSIDPSASRLASSWVADCAPLLFIETCLFRPQYVLCLGSDGASGMLAKGTKATKLAGRVIDQTRSFTPPGKKPVTFSFQSMVSVHPASVARRPEEFPDLVNALGGFWGLVKGERTSDVEHDLHHVCVYSEKHLRRIVDDIIAEATPGVPQPIAVDCEWHGKHPMAKDAYLRTVQFSHKPKHAWCVVLRKQGGKVVFKGGKAGVTRQLNRLLKSTRGRQGRKVRLGGHFLRADMPWLLNLGVDARDEFRVASTWGRTKTHGGWDTGTMTHAYMESVVGGYKLEALAARFCGVPRYDVALQAWKDKYCKETGLKDKELDGYGRCPDDVLHPYALYDADATIRLFYKLNGTPDRPGLLDMDRALADDRLADDDPHRSGRSCREAFWVSHKATLAALEMEMNGIQVDRRRGDELTQLFIEARDARLEEFRDLIGWNVKPGTPGYPDGDTFNVNSTYHVREFLFGVELNGKVDKATGDYIRLRPPGAKSLKLTPIKAAGKDKMTWERVVREGRVGLYNPGADKETLGILSHDETPTKVHGPHAGDRAWTKGDLVGFLRDIKFVAQVLKGTLRPPFEMSGQLVLDDDDDLTYDGGLMYWMSPEDGRVRTHFGLVETGRWSSWLPNLQNISKRREEDYQRILGVQDKDSKFYRETGNYKFPIRSILCAKPGHVLIEADYKMAEMAMIGMEAQDEVMLEMVRRNTLPESHPDFIDLHSLTAIEAFKLDTPANRALLDKYNEAKGTTIAWAANKDVLKAIGCSALRVAAKNVNFGVPYQRSAEAIARQCREEGADVSVEEAQQLIDAYYARYPKIAAFLQLCMERVISPGWLCGAFGRFRRFPDASDQAVVAEQQRQACNFPIQNGVADAITLACANLYDYRNQLQAAGDERTFDMCLQIHDALLFEVPVADVSWFVDEVLPLCMRDNVNIWPRDLDGKPLPGVTQPYHLDIDVEAFRYWGEKIDRDWGLEQGLPEATPGGCKILPKAKKKAA